jgi:glycosyltransferase involved in cell wall biosynthesis
VAKSAISGRHHFWDAADPTLAGCSEVLARCGRFGETRCLPVRPSIGKFDDQAGMVTDAMADDVGPGPARRATRVLPNSLATMPLAGTASGRIRVLRIFHAGRNAAHRARDRALLAAGVDVVYVVPRFWPEPGSEPVLSSEAFPIVEVSVRSPGDINRHSYADVDAVAHLAVEHRVDLVDLCEEPFSRAAGQLLPRLPRDLAVVMYSAQNLDKRWPPPFQAYERRSFQRVHAFYPCSHQAASVLRGKGFGGLVVPLPLGYDEGLFPFGEQSLSHGDLRLALVGRMVQEKGVCDAIWVLANLRGERGIDAHLVLAGSGPALADAIALADQLGVGDHVEHLPWLPADRLGELLRNTHVVLTPSRSTATWAEQFGRMIVEAQASGCVVVGYDSGSISEVAGPGALLVDEGNLHSLAGAAARALGDDEEFQERRQSGRELARARTWSSVASQQVEIYRAALERAPAQLLAGSPRVRRQRAVSEFGRPAEALGQTRPFAVAGLRRPNRLTRALGKAMDLLAEVPPKAGRSA